MNKVVSIGSIAQALDPLRYLPTDLNRIVSDYLDTEKWANETLGERLLGPDFLTQVWGEAISGIPCFPDLNEVDIDLIEQGARDANVVLVCVPTMILEQRLTIKSLKNRLRVPPSYDRANADFYAANWYDELPFSSEPIQSGWYLIRTDVPDDTRNKPYSDLAFEPYKEAGWALLRVGPAVFGMELYTYRMNQANRSNQWSSQMALCNEQVYSSRRVSVVFLVGLGVDIHSYSTRGYHKDMGFGLSRFILGADD